MSEALVSVEREDSHRRLRRDGDPVHSDTLNCTESWSAVAAVESPILASNVRYVTQDPKGAVGSAHHPPL